MAEMGSGLGLTPARAPSTLLSHTVSVLPEPHPLPQPFLHLPGGSDPPCFFLALLLHVPYLPSLGLPVSPPSSLKPTLLFSEAFPEPVP